MTVRLAELVSARLSEPSLPLPYNRKRRTRAADQILIKSAVKEMISISSMAPAKNNSSGAM